MDVQRETLQRIILGQSQIWTAIGFVVSNPEKTVIKGTDWFMMVNFETRQKDGRRTTVRCMFKGDIASTFEEQFRWGDILYLTGEVSEYHAGAGYDNFQIKNCINVLSFSFITDYKGEVEPLSEEKAEFLQRCSDLFDHTAEPPTTAQILEYKQLREKRAQQNKDRREKAGLPPIGKNHY